MGKLLEAIKSQDFTEAEQVLEECLLTDSEILQAILCAGEEENLVGLEVLVKHWTQHQIDCYKAVYDDTILLQFTEKLNGLKTVLTPLVETKKLNSLSIIIQVTHKSISAASHEFGEATEIISPDYLYSPLSTIWEKGVYSVNGKIFLEMIMGTKTPISCFLGVHTILFEDDMYRQLIHAGSNANFKFHEEFIQQLETKDCTEPEACWIPESKEKASIVFFIGLFLLCPAEQAITRSDFDKLSYDDMALFLNCANRYRAHERFFLGIEQYQATHELAKRGEASRTIADYYYHLNHIISVVINDGNLFVFKALVDNWRSRSDLCKSLIHSIQYWAHLIRGLEPYKKLSKSIVKSQKLIIHFLNTAETMNLLTQLVYSHMSFPQREHTTFSYLISTTFFHLVSTLCETDTPQTLNSQAPPQLELFWTAKYWATHKEYLKVLKRHRDGGFDDPDYPEIVPEAVRPMIFTGYEKVKAWVKSSRTVVEEEKMDDRGPLLRWRARVKSKVMAAH